MHNSSGDYSVAVSPNFIIRVTVPKPVSSCEYSFCSPSYKQISCDLLVFTSSITTIELIFIVKGHAFTLLLTEPHVLWGFIIWLGIQFACF